ncbi:SDR family oxidoreductase [Jannaschia aquimarina]|uniref:UDP-glucose 4-epimerase n=1 Tax=Jannaschia aquimarina TaxID=935700 RepID=A0A0D1EM85_9RHOB|nr:aldehyde reductase [Jannaschia aquimarina]KIT18096.1 UDP-glucose 4-epimerase [Jannaschia aquimarina]SNT40778.1 dihydroflavonol-4-reductase [Jannaschia aquimarina]
MSPSAAPLTVLVTGANGFIASHVVERLLRAGHSVTGTVRDPADKSKTAHLRAMEGAGERLTLVAADLTDPDPFSAHMDVNVVMHMASPYAVDVDDPQRDLVDPAVKGTRSALEAAAKSPRVRRVVLTSSMAAISDEPDGRVLTEGDWNGASSLTRNPYYYSKTLAERAAWAFLEQKTPGFDLSVINPFLVVGPSHTKAINASNQILVDILNGVYPAVMDLDWGFVDVRDVADAHVAAMDPAVPQGRYIAASGNMTMAEVVALMRAEGYSHAKLPRLSLANSIGSAVMKLASYTQPKGVGSYLRTHLGRHPRFDNTRARDVLGIDFRPPTESVRDTLADLTRWGHVPQPRKEAA